MTKPSTIPAFLALGCVSAAAFATAAQAQEAPAQTRQGGSLGGMTVTDTPIEENEVKVDRPESAKYTAPLLDTPQTITILSNTTLRQQNLLTLREALTTIPGITFGAGEGGGGYGDSINLRGQTANNDIQIDGVRDSAQYSRSDTFNLQQIEVVNGANSVYAGSGSISGTINLVTKRPQADTVSIVSGSIGTDDYFRGTVDANVRVSDFVAIRLNAMAHRNDVPSRDVERYKRWGVAPSVTLGIDSATRLTFLYQHQEDDNVPIYGVPYYAVYDGRFGGLLPGADYQGYYGYKDVDEQDQTLDQATIIFDHEFNDRLSLRNLARWQRIEQNTLTNSLQGTFCLGVGPFAGTAANATAAATACPAGLLPGFYEPSGPRGTTRLAELSTLYNQLDLRGVVDTGGIEHTITFGASFQQEDYKLRSGNSLRNPGGALPNPALPQIDIANPDPVYGGPVNFVPTARQDGDTRNLAVYLFDTIKISEMFELNGGVRWENNRAIFRADTIDATPGASFGGVTPGVNQVSDEDLFSYRIGAVFKPIPNASLYVAYGNSETPTSLTVRGGCGLASAQTLFTDPCAIAPQKAENYEIGGKIDLADGGLQLTAALFRNDRTNFPVASNDPLLGTVQVLDGRSRVDGIALGATGQITPGWTIFANYTYLDSEVKQSVSDFCLANPGSTFTPPGGTAIICPASDVQAGNRLTQVPKHSGSLFTTYRFPFGLSVGYGFTYTGSFFLTNATGSPFYKSDDWLTHRAYLAYELDNGLALQLNVQNFTDEKYFTGIRNNGWATPGDGRSAILTASYNF